MYLLQVLQVRLPAQRCQKVSPKGIRYHVQSKGELQLPQLWPSLTDEEGLLATHHLDLQDARGRPRSMRASHQEGVQAGREHCGVFLQTLCQA